MDPTVTYNELAKLPADPTDDVLARRGLLLSSLCEAQGRYSGIASSAAACFEQLGERGVLGADLRWHYASVLELLAGNDPQQFQKAVSMQQAVLQSVEPLHFRVYTGYVRCLLRYARSLQGYAYHPQAVSTMQRAQAQAVALCFALLEAHVDADVLGEAGVLVPQYVAASGFAAAFRAVAGDAATYAPAAALASEASADACGVPGAALYALSSLCGKALWALLSAGGSLRDVRCECDKILRWICVGTGKAAPPFDPSAPISASAAETNEGAWQPQDQQPLEALWATALACLQLAHDHAPEPAAVADAALELHDASIEYLAAHATTPRKRTGSAASGSRSSGSSRSTQHPVSGAAWSPRRLRHLATGPSHVAGASHDPFPGASSDAGGPPRCLVTTPLAGSKRERGSSTDASPALVRPAAHASPMSGRQQLAAGVDPAAAACVGGSALPRPPPQAPGSPRPSPPLRGSPSSVFSPSRCSPKARAPVLPSAVRDSSITSSSSMVPAAAEGTPVSNDLPDALFELVLSSPQRPTLGAAASAAVSNPLSVCGDPEPASAVDTTLASDVGAASSALDTTMSAAADLDATSISHASMLPTPRKSPPRQLAPPSSPSTLGPEPVDAASAAHRRVLRLLDRDVSVLAAALRCLGVHIDSSGALVDAAVSPRDQSADSQATPAFYTAAAYPEGSCIEDEDVEDSETCRSASAGHAVASTTASEAPHSTASDPRHDGKRRRMLGAALGDGAAAKDVAAPGSGLLAAAVSTSSLAPSPTLSLASASPVSPCLRASSSSGSVCSVSSTQRRVRWSECVLQAEDTKRRLRLVSFDDLPFGPQGDYLPGSTPRDAERAAYKGADAPETTPLLPAGRLPPSAGGVSKLAGAWPLAMPSLRCVPLQPPRHSPLSTGFSHRTWQLAEQLKAAAAAAEPDSDRQDGSSRSSGTSPTRLLRSVSAFEDSSGSSAGAPLLQCLRGTVDDVLAAYTDESLRDAQVVSLRRAYAAASFEAQFFRSIRS